MRMRTVFAITLTMFALPALAAELPTAPCALPIAPPPPIPAGASPDLFFEVRILKVPVGFCESGKVKLTGNTVLTDDNLRRLLEAAQMHPDATVTQLPKVTAFDGQEMMVKNCEQQLFATSLEAVKVKGQTVLVPQNKPIELGDTLTISGHVLADLKRVSVRAKLTRTALAGNVELVPVTTQITPVFEGGSQGKPIPFTQFLQAPDVKTEQIEKSAIVSSGATIVLGSWKETGERPARGKGLLKKEKAATEYEVVAFATVRVDRAEVSVAPMPRELPARATKVFCVQDLVVPAKTVQGAAISENADGLVKVVTDMVRPYSWVERGGRGTAEFFDLGCALVVTNTPDVLREVGDLLEALNRLQAAAPVARAPGELLLPLGRPQIGVPVAPAPREAKQSVVIKLRNVAAADIEHAVGAFIKARKLDAVVVAEPVSNTVLLSAKPVIQQQLLDILTALDKQPTQVVIQAMIVEVPDGFVKTCGLTVGAKPEATSWTLTAREYHMFFELIRAAKARDECSVLSRPQLQVTDNQTGFVDVGQDFPHTAADGKIETVRLGSTLRATPRVGPDGRVLLRYEVQLTELGAPVVVGKPGAANGEKVSLPTIKKQSRHETAELRTGETLVTRVGETLVIVTPTVVK